MPSRPSRESKSIRNSARLGNHTNPQVNFHNRKFSSRSPVQCISASSTKCDHLGGSVALKMFHNNEEKKSSGRSSLDNCNYFDARYVQLVVDECFAQEEEWRDRLYKLLRARMDDRDGSVAVSYTHLTLPTKRRG